MKFVDDRDVVKLILFALQSARSVRCRLDPPVGMVHECYDLQSA